MADLRDEQDLPSAGEVSVVVDDASVPEEEREEILKEIETMVSEGRPSTEMAEEYLRPRRSGILFPVILNLVAVAAVAAGIFFISRYFQTREADIATGSQSYFSAEAQLIEEILRESEQQLEQKDQEINNIQSQMDLLNQEKDDLESNLENQVAEREAELRAQLDAELEAERARLAEAGQSEADINAQLAAIEAEREAEFNSELESFRTQAQAELDLLASQLDAQQAQLEQTLAASREERDRIAAEAAQREDELREELGAEIEQLEEEQQAAQDRISELQSIREEEALLADRILGSFAVIVQDIQEGLSEEALDGLDSLERLLRDQRPIDAEGQQQRQTQLALASTLRGLVQEVDVLRDNIAVRDLTTSEDEEAALEQQRAAELIETAAGVVALAETARGAGRFDEARSLYQQALSTIPSLETVYPGILELESARRHMIMQASVVEAQSLLAAGSSEAAVTTYLQALQDITDDERDPLLEVAAGIRSANTENQRVLLAAQQSLEDDLQADIDARDQQITALNQQLISSRNQAATSDATISELRNRLETLSSQLAAREAALGDRSDDLDAAEERVTELEDALATAQVDLRTAETRIASLEQTLESARNNAASLEESEAAVQSQLDSLTSEVETLRQQLATSEQRLARADSDAGDQQQLITSLEVQIADLDLEVSSLELANSTLESEKRGLQEQLSSAQQQLASSQQQLTSAQQQLASAQQQATTYEQQVASLQEQVDSLQGELAARPEVASEDVSVATQAEIDGLNATISRLNTETDGLNSNIASLNTTIEGLNATIADHEATIAGHEATISGHESTIARHEATIASNNGTIEAGNEEIAGLNATIAELNASVAERDATIENLSAGGANLSTEITQREDSIDALESQLESIRADLRTAESERDSVQTDLDTAQDRISGLETQISTLRGQRDSATGDVSSLETEVSRLTEEVDLLEEYRDRVETLTGQYETAQTAAVRLAAAGNYATARDRLLRPLASGTANEILPGVATNVEQILAGLITQAEEETAEEAREETLGDVTGFTDQVKRNMDDPQGSAAVASYLQREPDLQAVANEVFEIIELSERDISAPEVSYRLLGSVSRQTGNLVVVERLVALDPEVGDSVEIRRTPELGQEVPVALGAIIEVTDRRVVVSVDRIYNLNVEPQLSDVVYLAQD